jgi:hypothetical protein
VSGGRTTAGALLSIELSDAERLSISWPSDAEIASGVTSASTSALTFSGLLRSAMNWAASVCFGLLALMM